MKIILCMYIDREGHIQIKPQLFKPKTADICVSDFNVGDIKGANNILFHTLMVYDENRKENTCWTTQEILRRCEEMGSCKEVKVFTNFEHYYPYMTEVQFAFSQNQFSEYDYTIDIDVFKEVVSCFNKERIGSDKNGNQFFRYTK